MRNLLVFRSDPFRVTVGFIHEQLVLAVWLWARARAGHDQRIRPKLRLPRLRLIISERYRYMYHRTTVLLSLHRFAQPPLPVLEMAARPGSKDFYRVLNVGK